MRSFRTSTDRWTSATPAKLRAALWLLALPGCIDLGTRDLPPEEWRTCTRDDECTYYEAGCCDHCNHGTALPVRKDCRERAEKTHVANCTFGIFGGCTLMWCPDPVSRCRAGLCVLEAPETIDVLDHDAGSD